MSKMADYLIELEEDFECLNSTSMQWSKEIWGEQAEDNRFIVAEKDWQFSHIYWYENYTSLMAAKSILRELGEEYKVHFDTWSGEWVLLSTYKSNSWKD